MSADRFIQKPIVGPDRGEVPSSFAQPVIKKATHFDIGFIPLGNSSQVGADRNFHLAAVGPDWGKVEDKYGPKEIQRPNLNAYQLALDNSPRTTRVSEMERFEITTLQPRVSQEVAA